jgi:uncharacterized protein (UPF0332 family)
MGGTEVALSPLEVELLLISKYKKSQIDWLRNGIRIEQAAGRSIGDLLLQACAARHSLAGHFLKSAALLLKVKPARHRDGISRSYYSMYHAARAVVFLANQGDDHQEHDQLYRFLPSDFPDVDSWQNELKDARLKRNEADYDFFPKSNLSFRTASISLFGKAKEFHAECTHYLRNRGCPL